MGQDQPQRVAVILAAGRSERMGFPKPLLDAGAGKTFLSRLADTFSAAGARPLAVLGFEAAAVRAAHPWLWAIDNRDWEQGQWSSLKAGLGAALESGAQQVLVHLVDAPRVSALAVQKLYPALGTAAAAVSRHGRAPGHPVGLTADAARAVLANHRVRTFAEALVFLRVAPVDTGEGAVIENLNTPEAYQRAFGHPPRLV
jgi:molybdenum cofactor cytidylyltransferase